MLVEKYPIGWAVDARKTDPFIVYLIDLPGVAMQGRSFVEAIDKLKAVVPSVLARYNAEGKALPAPSREPTLTLGGVYYMPRWIPAQATGTSFPAIAGSFEFAHA